MMLMKVSIRGRKTYMLGFLSEKYDARKLHIIALRRRNKIFIRNADSKSYT